MESSLPFIGMVLAVTALAVNMIVSKVAMSNGTSFFVISVYSHALASLILFPTGFLFHRRSKHPPLTFPILCRIFLLACFGCLADITSYAGINTSSPTLGTELLNLVPGFTYILAIIVSFCSRRHVGFPLKALRSIILTAVRKMEGLNLRKSGGISKSIGTIVSIVGASIVTLYKGPAILNKALMLASSLASSSQQNWILGGILLSIAAFSTAAWSIVQTWILKIYPVEMMVVAIYSVFLTVQSTVVALIAEKDLSAWKLQAKMGLVAVLYAGIINITFRLFMMSWCLSRTGPLFVSLFNPLTIVISVIIGVIFFQEVLYFGSVAGAVILVIGFYAVIWGKAREIKMEEDAEICDSIESSSYVVPLLKDTTIFEEA